MLKRHSRVRARVACLITGALAAALLVVVPRPAAAADPYREVSLALGQGLLVLFPAAEGYVVSASGGEAYVDLSQKDLLQPGMELQLYRPGADMIHPVTKQVLGAYEKNLGVLRVAEVRDTYSRGTLDAAGAAAGIVPGDRVRLSARRLRTLLHVAGAAPGIEIGPLAQALIARCEESGRFTMIDEAAWAPSLAALKAPWETVRADPAALRRLGELAAADLLLQTKIEPGDAPRVAIEVRSLRTGTVLGELSERWTAPPPAAPRAATPPGASAAFTKTAVDPFGLGEGERAPAAVPSAPAAPEPAEVPGEYTVRELATPARSLAVGNILGEGRPDVVVTDGFKLSLFRWEEQALAWRWDEAGRGGRRILSLDVMDVDADARDEVLVTTLARGRVTSELRRWRDGALQVAGSIDGVYLRAAPRSGEPALLFGQRAGIDEVLAGRVEQYRLREGSFERIEGSALPRGVGIFGLALAPDLPVPAPGGSPVALYSLDRAGVISGLTQAGAAVWRSARPYGGYPPALSAHELFGPGAVDEQIFDEEVRAFQGRLLAVPASGKVRLIVPRNFFSSLMFTRQRVLGQGEIALLEGPPGSLEEVRRSRSFDGYVADLARADINGDGNAEILFIVNRIAGVLTGERGRLVAWRPTMVAAGGK